MEQHFAALRIPDSEINQGRSRTRSFSELPAARRIILEQTYKTGNTTDLIRQYSCEQVFDAHANIRQIKFSQVLTSGAEDHNRVWSPVVPHFSIQNASDWDSHKKTKAEYEVATNQVEQMEIDDISPQKCQIIPPKSLPLSENTLKEPDVDIQSITSVEADNKRIHTFSANTPYKVHEKRNVIVKRNIDSDSQHPKVEYQELKKRFRPLVQPETQSNMVIMSSFCNCWKLIFLLLLPIAVLMIAIMINSEVFETRSNCKQGMYYTRACDEIHEKIHGQDQAVFRLVYFLKDKNSCKRIVALVGGTGVGKSYTGEIIGRNFPDQRNVFHYYSPLKHKMNNIKLSKRACNLIIMENLKESDVNDAATFSSTIENMEDYCTTILMIFNMQETDENLNRNINLPRDTEMIKNAFTNQNLDVEVIAYKKLNEPALEHCIKDAAKKSNIDLSKHDIKDIMKILQRANSGCKGAYSKVQIMRKASP